MTKKILLTSFDIWLPHHTSNAGDDLLLEIAQLNLPNLLFLRKLPVDIQLASELVIAKIKEVQPDVIICCGMAEKRLQLTVESTATCADAILKTQVNLEGLVANLTATEISHDAGKFVCEGLYYSVLKYLQDEHSLLSCAIYCPCLFVHVPVLNESNLEIILADFKLIIQNIVNS